MTEENKQLKHETFYASVGVAIFDPATKKFLVLKDADGAGWGLPGGRMHTDESALDTLMREVREETGLNAFEVIGVVDANRSHSPYRNGVPGFSVTFLVYYQGGEVQLSAEHSEYRWVTLEEIETNPEFKEWFKERMRKVVKYIEEKSPALNK